jgi:tRNA uridine 5-carbamoylmethylation protein Kti12
LRLATGCDTDFEFVAVTSLSGAAAILVSEEGWYEQVGRGQELQLTEPISTAQLRRLKRGFLKITSSGMDERLSGDLSAIKELFIDYLRSHLAAMPT